MSKVRSQGILIVLRPADYESLKADAHCLLGLLLTALVLGLDTYLARYVIIGKRG